LTSRLPWSLFLPVSRHGQAVSWTTRAVGKGASRRYISADHSEEALPIKSLLYGEDYCRSAVIVVEGPMDAIRVGSGAVATFGLNVSPAQVARLAGFPLRAVCFDNEQRAQRVAERLCSDLSAFPGETVRVQLESGDDPGSADEEELDELRKMFLGV
jgi:DNA primase